MSERDQMLGAYSQFRVPTVPVYVMALAQLFGERTEFVVDETRVISYHWRGRVYVTGISDVTTGKRL